MRADRLLTLAAFLDNLPEEKFNFAIIAEERGKPMLEALAAGHTRCGTVACAIGWLPAVFPADFKWTDAYYKSRSVTRDGSIDFSAAEEFFDLTVYQAEYLFMPGRYNDDDEFVGNLNDLTDEATPKQVAAHIRAFVEEHS